MAIVYPHPVKIKGYCRNKEGDLSCWEMSVEDALTKASVATFIEDLTIEIEANDFFTLPGLALIQGGKA
jgi:hypothetical protein